MKFILKNINLGYFKKYSFYFDNDSIGCHSSEVRFDIVVFQMKERFGIIESNATNFYRVGFNQLLVERTNRKRSVC